MATAHGLAVTQVVSKPDGSGATYTISVLFSGADIPNDTHADLSECSFDVLNADLEAVITASQIQAMKDEAQRLHDIYGTGYVLGATDIIFLPIKRTILVI